MITRTTPEEEILGLVKPCSCNSCSNGCKFSSGFLVESDKERIASFLGISSEELESGYLEKVEMFNKQMLRPKVIRKGPYGPCVFLEEGLCKVHPVKPLECKISMPCSAIGEELIQWFLLNHVVNVNDVESIRQWKVYLVNHKAIPGGSLSELVPDKEKLRKILSYEILK